MTSNINANAFTAGCQNVNAVQIAAQTPKIPPNNLLNKQNRNVFKISFKCKKKEKNKKWCFTCFHLSIAERIFSEKIVRRRRHTPTKWRVRRAIDRVNLEWHENMQNLSQPQSIAPKSHECLDSQIAHNLGTNELKSAATIKIRNYSAENKQQNKYIVINIWMKFDVIWYDNCSKWLRFSF